MRKSSRTPKSIRGIFGHLEGRRLLAVTALIDSGDLKINGTMSASPMGPADAAHSPAASFSYDLDESQPHRLVSILDRWMSDLQEGKTPNREQLLRENSDLGIHLPKALESIGLIHRIERSPMGFDPGPRKFVRGAEGREFTASDSEWDGACGLASIRFPVR